MFPCSTLIVASFYFFLRDILIVKKKWKIIKYSHILLKRVREKRGRVPINHLVRGCHNRNEKKTTTSSYQQREFYFCFIYFIFCCGGNFLDDPFIPHRQPAETSLFHSFLSDCVPLFAQIGFCAVTRINLVLILYTYDVKQHSSFPYFSMSFHCPFFFIYYFLFLLLFAFGFDIGKFENRSIINRS